MTTKFLFDTEFSPVAGRRARSQPNAAPEKPAVYSESEVEQFRTEAFQAGMEAGQNQSMENTETTLAATMTRVGEQLQALITGQGTALQTIRQEAAELALGIATKLAPKLVGQMPETEVLGLLEECLSDLRDEPRIVVRAHDDICPALAEKVDGLSAVGGFQGSVIVLPDPARQPGDCLIEWADGGTERNMENLQRKIDGIVSRYTRPAAGMDNA